jgi:two-component system, chemotaxis family, chemotaxis protein CheY
VQRIKSDLKKSVGKTVLVVDDNAAIRKMIAAAFLSDGFKTCVEANNGSEAIDTAKRIQPDLITLDVSMPVMNGLEAAPHLRKLFPETPIILFTMYGTSQLETGASKLGVNLVLAKTTPLATLVEEAHKLLVQSVSLPILEKKLN